MNASRDSLLDRIRQPAYTGANRCLPCTVVNVAMGVAVAGALAAVASPSVGVAALGVALAAVWLRGYLVPGTPELTKRYLPARVLALFGKTPGGVGSGARAPGAVDPEAYLLDADVLVETPDGSDLAFAPGFAAAWREAVAAAERDGRTVTDGRAVDGDRLALAGLTGLDPDALSLDWRGETAFAFTDDERIGHWESRAAFRADVAADRALTATRDDWPSLALADRSAVLGALRLFVDECPVCGGTVSLEERAVESCCSSYDVVAGRCAGCDARLFEIDLPASAVNAQE